MCSSVNLAGWSDISVVCSPRSTVNYQKQYKSLQLLILIVVERATNNYIMLSTNSRIYFGIFRSLRNISSPVFSSLFSVEKVVLHKKQLSSMIYHAPEKFIPYHSKHFFKMANDGSIERWAWILANLLLYSFNYCKKISKFSPKCFKLSLFFKNKNKKKLNW